MTLAFSIRIRVVVPGDTLPGIACVYGTTVEDSQGLNDMGRRTGLAAGQTLLVPVQRHGSKNGAADCR